MQGLNKHEMLKENKAGEGVGADMGGTIVRTFEVCDVEMTDAINLGAVSGSSFPIPGEAAVAFPPPPLQVSKRTDDPIAKATWGGVRSRRATPQRGKKKQKTQYSKYVGVTWNKTHKVRGGKGGVACIWEDETRPHSPSHANTHRGTSHV